MPLSPVRSLQRGSRPIGPVYKDTERAANKLKKDGYDREAGALALQAAQQKLAGGGSNITSAEGNRDERDAIEVAQSGLSRERRDAVLKGNAAEKGLTVEATGAQLTARKGLYERMRSGVTPEMKAEATSLGITDSGFAKASASAAKNRLTRPGAAPVASTVAGAAAAAPAADNSYFTEKPFEFAAKEAGEPARRLAMRAAEDKLTSTPQFGAGPANQNIAKLGLDGAIADYKTRSAGAGKPPEPGNLAELKARDSVASPAAAVPVGPLQTALNEARARRETRAVDASEAADITAGLSAAPTPRLDTSFPVASAPAGSISPAPTGGISPAPTLRRPTEGRVSFTPSPLAAHIAGRNAGNARNAKLLADAEEVSRKKKAGIPDLAPSLGSGSGVNRLYKSVVARYTK